MDQPAIAQENSCVRFKPSRTDGLDDVSEVAIFRDRLEVQTEQQRLIFRFADIGVPQASKFVNLLRAFAGQHRLPLVVANRDWFHEPQDRYFEWFTMPRLKTCMPTDEVSESYSHTCFHQIRQLVEAGGFATFDLG